ncbi:hypothetical protein M422DRAFT_50921 [Sphaerobolus stellatus SS14]|uniref:separase n=1 Tax=Sphaerobolus stellatus (strain SS14) TaxID=990650 RepID=A0A0C9U1X1_SPHS4|nr:hypothetical protein M422DRAFT_50921 [Sphaerobolus stellatus SS14]
MNILSIEVVDTPPRMAQIKMSAHSKPTPPQSAPVELDPALGKLIGVVSQLLGLLGDIPLRIQFLNLMQKTAQFASQPSTDGNFALCLKGIIPGPDKHIEFIYATIAAAAEYLELGKVRRALTIYETALPALEKVSEDVKVNFMLNHSEALAIRGKLVKSVQLYEEARELADSIVYPPGQSMIGRIQAKIRSLEMSACAAKTFSVIQTARNDTHRSLASLKRCLRLWNKAYDALTHLLPNQSGESNPLDMASLAAALPALDSEEMRKTQNPPTPDGLHLRIADGLVNCLFDIAEVYLHLGSGRDSEYFLQRARELAQSLSSPVLVIRALAKLTELQLYRGHVQEVVANFELAENYLKDISGLEAADITRLHARQKQLLVEDVDANALYEKALTMVSELDVNLSSIERPIPVSGPRRSSIGSPGNPPKPDALAPVLLAKVLAQKLWLQRDKPEDVAAFMDRLSVLPQLKGTKAEQLAIAAKLALYNTCTQFGADLFLSSLSESTISIPLGLSSGDVRRKSITAKKNIELLLDAETRFWETFQHAQATSHVFNARNAATSLALIKFFQVASGIGGMEDARLAIEFMDASTAMTLKNELLEIIDLKFPEIRNGDLQWDTFVDEPSTTTGGQKYQKSSYSDEEENDYPDLLKSYWRCVEARYSADPTFGDTSSPPLVDTLPKNWTVINITLTEDKTALFVSRQRASEDPLLFCVPFDRHGRKEDGEEPFSFNQAIQEFADILSESDSSAKTAKDIGEDKSARTAWWAQRMALDKRMRDFLDNLEFCWLGAFKTIMHDPAALPSKILDDFRRRVQNVFIRSLVSAKRQVSALKLDDSLIRCIAALSSKCRDEELEDLIYFTLDLYQFYGVHVPLSEIDIDVLSTELRTVLEEYSSKSKACEVPVDDPHIFLVLDKNVQGLPWESIPFLRGRSISRIPSISFLIDRIEMAKVERRRRGLPVPAPGTVDRAVVDPRKTYYVVNPGGDLVKSQDRFSSWLSNMSNKKVGWNGVTGKAPSGLEVMNALEHKDLFIYIGHGACEQYVSSSKLKRLPRCAAAMLWGCSSGFMRDMGDFERNGIPYSYMLAGCSTLVACLWDVTDNDLDKFSQSVYDKLRLDSGNVGSWRNEREGSTSVITAVAQSREVRPQ